MPLVNVTVNQRAYTVACDNGEEDHLKELAGTVDKKVRELLGSVGQVGDQRLILMAALLLADDSQGAAAQVETLQRELAEQRSALREMGVKLTKAESFASDTLEAAANRVEHIAAGLARA